MNVGGIGMDVDVLERCQKGKLRGKIKYLMSLVKSLFAFKGCNIKIVGNGKEETRKVLIGAVCNGTQFGGGIQICPTADPTDQKLNVVIVDCIGGVWKIIKAFIQLMQGKVLQYPLTTHFECESVTFIPEEDIPIQLDGEIYHHHAFEAKLGKGVYFY